MIDVNWLSPIEQYDGIYYKRDDLFSPFDNGVNGGKVRQCFSLIESNLKTIQSNYNNTVVTTTNMDSPQGIIVATVCNHFNIRCIVCYGTPKTKEELIKNKKLVKAVSDIGGEVRVIAKVGYTTVVNSNLMKLVNEKNYFLIKFGINSIENDNSIFGVIENQTKNIPENLDLLIVPVGSGLIFSGILRGLLKNNNIPKKIIGILSGMNSRKNIRDYLINYPIFELNESVLIDVKMRYDLIMSEFTYHQKHIIDYPFKFDPIYESKSMIWLNTQELSNKKVLLWIVGNQRNMLTFK